MDSDCDKFTSEDLELLDKEKDLELLELYGHPFVQYSLINICGTPDTPKPDKSATNDIDYIFSWLLPVDKNDFHYGYACIRVKNDGTFDECESYIEKFKSYRVTLADRPKVLRPLFEIMLDSINRASDCKQTQCLET